MVSPFLNLPSFGTMGKAAESSKDYFLASSTSVTTPYTKRGDQETADADNLFEAGVHDEHILKSGDILTDNQASVLQDIDVSLDHYPFKLTSPSTSLAEHSLGPVPVESCEPSPEIFTTVASDFANRDAFDREEIRNDSTTIKEARTFADYLCAGPILHCCLPRVQPCAQKTKVSVEAW